jgi:hypothetical protein
MNNVLFGLIGVFMFAITGLGFAEVKGQMDADAARARGAVAAQGDVAGAADTNTGKTTQQKQERAAPTVAGSLASVAQKVADAADDVSLQRSHDDGDGDEGIAAAVVAVDDDPIE